MDTMFDPMISVIITVHKSSKYLEACVNSLVNQKLKEIEIILVNDCSPDPDDEKICLNFQRQDQRVLYFRHAENLGPGGARNTGIQHATAPYLGFLDSDDCIHPDMYQHCLSEMIRGNYDVVQCNSERISVTGKSLGVILKLKERKELYGNAILDSMLKKNTGIHTVVWNKVWRRSILVENSLRFPEHFFFDDSVFVPQYLIYAKKALLLPAVYHYYLIRSESVVGTYTPRHIEQSFQLLDLLKDALSRQTVRSDWLDWYNGKCRWELTHCANKLENQPVLQKIFLDYLKQNPLLQNMNFQQLRFSLNYMNGTVEKRLRLLTVEILAQLGLLKILKRLLRR